MSIKSLFSYDTYTPVQDTRGLAASRAQPYLTLDSSLFKPAIEEFSSQDQDPSEATTPRLKFSSEIDLPEKVDEDFDLGRIDETVTKLYTAKNVRINMHKFDVITYLDKDKRIHYKLAKPKLVICQASDGTVLVTNKKGKTRVGESVFKK